MSVIEFFFFKKIRKSQSNNLQSVDKQPSISQSEVGIWPVSSDSLLSRYSETTNRIIIFMLTKKLTRIETIRYYTCSIPYLISWFLNGCVCSKSLKSCHLLSYIHTAHSWILSLLSSVYFCKLFELIKLQFYTVPTFVFIGVLKKVKFGTKVDGHVRANLFDIGYLNVSKILFRNSETCD